MDRIRELFYFVWYVLASLVGVIVKIPSPKHSANKQKILIVSGIGSQPLAFLFLKRFLEKRNFVVYFFPINILRTLGLGVKDISQVAQEIDAYVQKNNLKDIILIGMSAGAVASLFCLEECDGWRYVKRFIALSAAFKGGWISHLFPFIPLSSEFKPESKLVSMISKLHIRYPERAVSLFGTWDEFVLPESSELAGVKNIRLPEGGHAYLQTFSQKTFETIANLAS